MSVSVALGLTTDSPIDRSSDGDLIQSCLRGNKSSYRQLYRRYQQRVRSTLYQLCGALALDDLVQEVFLRVWKGLPKFRANSQFSTWIYRITWNVATDYRRELAKSYKQTQMLESPTQQVSPDGLNRLHYQDLVQRGLAQLNFEHRTVLVLHDLEDVPQKEIGSILGIPVGTVKSRLFHARNQLRQFLQEQGGLS